MVSCENDNEINEEFEKTVRIGFEKSNISLSAAGDKVYNSIAIFGLKDDDNWDIKANQPWLNLEKGSRDTNGKSEKAIEISAEKNERYSRIDSVYIRVNQDGDNFEKIFVVTQEGELEDPVLTISKSILNFSSSSGSEKIEVDTDFLDWTASTENDWIILKQQGDILTVEVLENDRDSLREGEIQVISDEESYELKEKIVVNQAKADDEESITVEGIEMILVKAGSYHMGAQKDDPAKRNFYPDAAANQSPVHKVTITKDFYIGKYPVTQLQYENIIGHNPSSTKGDDHPVEMVDYDDANEFVRELSKKTGKTFRLPTEAEWEYAARGGIESSEFIYSGSNDVDEVAYYFEDGGDQREKEVTVPVGSLAPNGLGIYDMSGNVYEWVLDEFVNYSSQDQTDPIGKGEKKMLRGGSWFHNKLSQAVSYRGSNTADFKRAYLGFRIIYVPEQ